MIDIKNSCVLLYQKDFSGSNEDQLYIFKDDKLSKVNADYLLEATDYIITHDYWLISPYLFSKLNKLPNKVIDLCELNKLLTGKKKSDIEKNSNEIYNLIKPFYDEIEDLKSYFEIFYKRSKFDEATYKKFATKMVSLWEIKLTELSKKNESTRFFNTEVPVFNILTRTVCQGIKINQEVLVNTKREIDAHYLRKLKEFGLKHNLLFEVPCNKKIEKILTSQGYDVSELGIEYILEYLPTTQDFGKDYLELKKISMSKLILSHIPSVKKRVNPILESQNSTTSRIYYKNPTLQNLSKKYRNIINADEGKQLAYIDFDQFEVGIMASLSDDPELIQIYNNKDVYTELSIKVFGNELKRSFSKGLFLAYTYGMNVEKIINAIVTEGGNEAEARDFYRRFSKFEQWKEEIESSFLKSGTVGTVCGNYLYRVNNKPELTTKEKRSCVNHVVQGTGSYIFKQTIIKVNDLKDVEILVPMHDALLVQTKTGYDNATIINTFQSTMSEILNHKINAKASISDFYA